MEQRKIISDPKVAHILASTEERRFLEPFIRREATLSQAAEELGVKLTTLHYHVRKLLRLGLIEVRREEPRKGRAMKIYGAAAEEFFVPFEITPSVSLEALMTQIMAAPNRSLIKSAARTLLEHSDRWGLRITRDERDKIVVAATWHEDVDDAEIYQTLLAPDFPATFLRSAGVNLDHTAAKALQLELHELFRRYESSFAKGQDYLLMAGLTPLGDEE